MLCPGSETVWRCLLCSPGKEPAADGMVDVMVRAEDASKINRIVERFKLATVDTASIKRDIEKDRQEKETAPDVPEQSAPQKEAEERLLDELFGAPIQKEAKAPENPTAAKTEKTLRPSLSPGRKGKPPRVLLKNPAPLSGRICGKSRLHNRKRLLGCRIL